MQNTSRETILIIDDNVTNIRMLEEHLKAEHCEVLIARNGKMGLERARLVSPDLILLDIQMPEIDGFEVCRQLKTEAATRDIPVIFLTVLTDVDAKVKGFEMGGVDYITKPIQQEEVLARVKTHLTLRHLYQQLHQENERFQRLAAATHEGIFFYECGQIIDANPTAVRLFGFSLEELRNMRFSELLVPGQWNTVEQRMAFKSAFMFEVQAMSRDGKRFPVELHWQPTESEQQEIFIIRDMRWRVRLKELHDENRSLKASLKDCWRFGDMIGRSPAMQQCYDEIGQAAATDVNVVIYGETGVGKELAAKMIHRHSARSRNDFVIVNCGAISPSLFEREFFGHRKGAFTGADRDAPGFFDTARGGTLFLDEIGELTQPMQVTLLRAIENKEYLPVGSTRSKQADVRIIAATNRDLKAEVENGQVREDFFYRLHVFPIHLPPLRERREDIPLLIDYFLQQAGQDGSPFPDKVRQQLSHYDWPGNVRELYNELHYYLATSRLHIEATQERIPSGSGSRSSASGERLPFFEAVERFEKELLLNTLHQHRWQKGKVAEVLGFDRKTLYNKMKRYGLI